MFILYIQNIISSNKYLIITYIYFTSIIVYLFTNNWAFFFQEEGIEFVKHFRCHLAPISHVATNSTGTLLCTASTEKTVKVFDVVNFGNIFMLPLIFSFIKCKVLLSKS